MSSLERLLVAAFALLLAYLALIALLIMADRRTEARALARLIPDCVVLLHRLLRDEGVPRRRKIVLLALLAYLAVPIDLVPDFIPVVGQLDDVLIAAVAIRYALRSGGPELVRRHWPGSDQSVQVVVRLAYGRRSVSDY